ERDGREQLVDLRGSERFFFRSDRFGGAKAEGRQATQNEKENEMFHGGEGVDGFADHGCGRPCVSLPIRTRCKAGGYRFDVRSRAAGGLVFNVVVAGRLEKL